jgi:hypothetical protein
MFNRILETAFDQGSEVILKIKSHSCDSYIGKIQSLDIEFLTLFHSGEEGGILWAFKREDIAFCGLVVELPEQLKEIDVLIQQSASQY